MHSLNQASSICFIACEKRPADDFTTFINERREAFKNIRVYATGGYAYCKLLSECSIRSELLDSSHNPKALAEKIAKECAHFTTLITSVGDSWNVYLQEAFALHAPNVFRIAYYDSLFPYVADNHGLYSKTASTVMVCAQMVLFANANLARPETIVYETPNQPIDLSKQIKRGLGYYPLHAAHSLRILRKDFTNKVAQEICFFEKNLRFLLKSKADLPKILVYFGGTSEKYFKHDFPAFLKLLSQAVAQQSLRNLVIVLQQHSETKKKDPFHEIEESDSRQLLAWQEEHAENPRAPYIVFSHHASEQVQSFADGVIYADIETAPEIAAAAIPLLNVSEKANCDLLVENNLLSPLTPESTSGTQFASALQDLASKKVPPISLESVWQALGYVGYTAAIDRVAAILTNPFSQAEESDVEDSVEKVAVKEDATPFKELTPSEPQMPARPARKFEINKSYWPYCLAATVALVSIVALAIRFWPKRVK